MSPTPKRLKFATAGLGFVVLLSTGCHTVDSGVEPEPLGYGPGAHVDLASGYVEDPVPRPAPIPWVPPERERISVQPPVVAIAPTPHVADVIGICEHLASFGTSLDPKAARADCLRRYRIARVFRTIGSWKTLAACIGSASAPPGVESCESETPAVFGGGDAYPREAHACMHLFALLIIEEMGPEPMLERQDILDFEPLVQECVDTLVNETRKSRSPSEYAAMLTCVEQAETSEAVEVCEADPP